MLGLNYTCVASVGGTFTSIAETRVVGMYLDTDVGGELFVLRREESCSHKYPSVYFHFIKLPARISRYQEAC